MMGTPPMDNLMSTEGRAMTGALSNLTVYILSATIIVLFWATVALLLV